MNNQTTGVMACGAAGVMGATVEMGTMGVEVVFGAEGAVEFDAAVPLNAVKNIIPMKDEQSSSQIQAD